jgi:hypothetical protein
MGGSVPKRGKCWTKHRPNAALQFYFVRSLFALISSNIRPTFIQHLSHFVQLLSNIRPQLVCTASKLYRVWNAGFTFASETAEKRRHSLPESGCGQMLPLGMETEVALPYLFRFAAFFNALFSFILGASKFQFFDCIAGSKNKSFLLILTIATNLTFGSSVGWFGGARRRKREGESDRAPRVALAKRVDIDRAR